MRLCINGPMVKLARPKHVVFMRRLAAESPVGSSRVIQFVNIICLRARVTLAWHMNRLAVVLLLCFVTVGCKPGDKTAAPEGQQPVGYSNHMTVNPPTTVDRSNNIYTRGTENKSANPAENPGISNRAAEVEGTANATNSGSGRP